MTPQLKFDGGAIFKSALQLFKQQAFVLVSFGFVAGLGSWSFASIMRPALGAMPTLVFETVIGSLIFAAQILLADDGRLGRRRPLEAVWARLQPRLVPLIVLPVAAAGLTVAGLLLLIVPGIYVAALLLPMTAIIVLEPPSMGALRRSIELARPEGWPLAGVVLRLVLVFFLATVPVSLILQQVVQGVGPALIWQAGIIAVNAALSGLSATVSLLVYLKLTEMERPEDVFE
ncbi:hypothetical protein [Oceanibium sediminis]|uniref:hypothetical protein n=1 Tax=Oceanibium sediminis TaxID=2026339 RepID=UPI000DD45330|nr:hypothetical protein [Oceanibium sediminis]